MIAESSLHSGSVEGNERGRHEKVASLVPRVEKRGGKPGETAKRDANGFSRWPCRAPAAAEAGLVGRAAAACLKACPDTNPSLRHYPLFGTIAFAPTGQLFLRQHSRQGRRNRLLGEIMEWTAPAFEEICLNCEINSYASAKL